MGLAGDGVLRRHDFADDVERGVAQALAEAGGTAPTPSPKTLTYEAVQAAGIVITRGCGDACPVVASRRSLDGRSSLNPRDLVARVAVFC